MTKSECKNQIFSFKITVENYRRIILNNESPLPWDSRTRLIPILRSQLNQTYGKLEKYVESKSIGGGIGMTYFSAFGSGSDSDVLEATASVIQNLDRIVGRLDAMSEEEFAELLKPKSHPSDIGQTISAVKHPHRWYWEMISGSVWSWVKSHISEVLIGVIIIVIGAVVLVFFGLSPRV